MSEGKSHYADFWECDGGCGRRVECTAPTDKESTDDVNAAIKALGWFVDGDGAYCPTCQKRIRRVAKKLEGKK